MTMDLIGQSLSKVEIAPQLKVVQEQIVEEESCRREDSWSLSQRDLSQVIRSTSAGVQALP
jgi:hypothetical protein